jgi:hypothetical protein
MTPDSIFQLVNVVALLAWLLLIIVGPFWFDIDKLLIGIIITALAVLYTWLLISRFNFKSTGDFGSLTGIMVLFADKYMVLAGWVHYLAFDLMTGIWIKKNALKHGIHYNVTVLCLFFTFVLGPLGLLMYLLVRWFKTRHYFSEN